MLPRMNLLLRRFQENGLNNYWKSDTIHLVTIASHVEEVMSGEDHVKVVTLDNISVAYYLLGIGYVASAIIFIFELIIYAIFKYKRRRKFKK